MTLAARIRNSLNLKAFVLFGVMAMVISTGVVLMAASSERSAQQALAQARGQAQILAGAAALAPALAAHDLIAAGAIRERINHQGGVQLDIYTADGHSLLPLAGTSLKNPGLAAPGAFSISTRVIQKNGMLYGATPVVANGQTLAVLRQSLDLNYGRAGFFSVLAANAWKGILLALAILSASMLMFSRLVRPLRALCRISGRAAKGDFSVRAETGSADEFGTLSANFNAMLERQKINMDRTRWLAYGDSLTRLANKTAFHETLRRSVVPGQPPGAMMLVDVDGFKRFNDAYGQEEGDRILTLVAQRLRQVIEAHAGRFAVLAQKARPLLARLSGDEFGILMPGARSVPEIQIMANAMLEAIAAPIDLAGHSASLSARIGIALYPHDAGDARHLLTSVNFAIDEAKKAGGGTVRFFEPAMSQKALQRMTLQSELRRAIRDNELRVFYQPKIDVRKGTIAGCEALVRWQQPSGTLVGPGHFIEAAEESGLIREIGNYVLEQSCLAAARWVKAGFDCPVAVNVSAVQFASNDFTPIVFAALEKAGLSPAKLELELTESVAMTNPERMLEQIGPLRDQGVRFAIDDFGTGHSSLAYLTRLPFDVFKIDQSFVQSMTEDKHARVIVQTVLAMAESLGYRTIAEGVETREHFAFLQLHCCDYVQGYYFAKPMPEADLVSMLQAERENFARSDSPQIAQAG